MKWDGLKSFLIDYSCLESFLSSYSETEVVEEDLMCFDMILNLGYKYLPDNYKVTWNIVAINCSSFHSKSSRIFKALWYVFCY